MDLHGFLIQGVSLLRFSLHDLHFYLLHVKKLPESYSLQEDTQGWNYYILFCLVEEHGVDLESSG